MIKKILNFFYPNRVKDDANDQFIENRNHDFVDNRYGVCRHTIRKRFVIPVGGINRKQAERQIQKLMNDYNQEIDWNAETKWPENIPDFVKNSLNSYYIPDECWIPTGTTIPFQKDYWIPTNKKF